MRCQYQSIRSKVRCRCLGFSTPQKTSSKCVTDFLVIAARQ